MIGEPKTLADWQKILEELGFEHKFYQYVCGELTIVDWFKEKEHILTYCCSTKEYDDYLMSLPEGTEYTPDWEQHIVTEIEIETKEFAYPEGHCDIDKEWVGNIKLSDYSYFENFYSLSLDYFNKALWMSRNPIKAKNKIVRKYISEVDLFLQKYSKVLEELKFKEEGDCLLQVGSEIYQTEPFLSYYHNNEYRLGGISFNFNMFTEKIYYTKYVKNKENNYISYLKYQINLNDIDSEEFKELLIEHLKNNNIYDF